MNIAYFLELINSAGTHNPEFKENMERIIFHEYTNKGLPNVDGRYTEIIEKYQEEIRKRERIQKEKERKRQEELHRQELERKRILFRKRLRVIIAFAVVINIGLFIFAKQQFEKARVYSEAEGYLEEGNYLQAIEVFKGIVDYSDVDERILECYYDEGIRLLSNGNYEAAQNAFIQAQPYSDASEQAIEAQYCLGKSQYQMDSYEEAITTFAGIMDYKDVRSIIQNDANLCNMYYTLHFQAGSTIEFGRYRQTDYQLYYVTPDLSDPNIAEAIMPIRWRILSNDGKELFLVSDNVLECMAFNDSKDATTWDSCSLRTWLNSSFYMNAFTDEERRYIERSRVANSGNPRNGTRGGETTNDWVFCLSVEEIEEYLPDPGTWYSDYSYHMRHVASTFVENVIKEYYNDQAYWWTRTPGDDLTGAVMAQPGGNIDYNGGEGEWVNMQRLGVRPAIRLTLNPSLIL